MMPTPKYLPVLTMGLLIGGMAIFIPARFFPVLAERVFMAVGTTVFFAGMIAAVVGMIWSICTLTNSALRRAYGITTPIVTILIAAFAWSGAWLTVYKFKKSHNDQVEANASIVADAAREAK